MPGCDEELQDFTVTGKAAAEPAGTTADLFAEGTKDYAAYVDGVVDAMVTSTEP